MNNISSSKRIRSLDNLRAFAILIVVIYHYQYFISHNNDFGALSYVGWIGVDLFFVLSGYLISSHLFTEFNQGTFSFKTFYLKRFFKTLPNYYFVLILYFTIPFFPESPVIVPLWKYLFFIQNYNMPISGFSQSWSLCVEEQFYLIFPILIILIMRTNKKLLVGFLLTLVIAALALRYTLWQHLEASNNLKDYTTVIYYPTYCRLDGLICGILIAYLQSYHLKTWDKIAQYGNVSLIIGIIALTGVIYMVHDRTSFVSGTIGFPATALAFGIIIISALSYNSLLNKLQLKMLSNLAKWSYAIYLVQKPISLLVAHWFSQLGFNNNASLIILANISIQIFAGWVLFYLVENNFMKLRNKILSSNML